MFDRWDKHVIWTPCDRSFNNLARRLYDLRHPKVDRMKRTFWPGFSRRINHQKDPRVYILRSAYKPSMVLKRQRNKVLQDKILKLHYRDISPNKKDGHWKGKNGPVGQFTRQILSYGKFIGFDDDRF